MKISTYIQKVHSIMDEISPIKTVRISGCRHYSKPWMSRDLENSSRKKMRLYKKKKHLCK